MLKLNKKLVHIKKPTIFFRLFWWPQSFTTSSDGFISDWNTPDFSLYWCRARQSKWKYCSIFGKSQERTSWKVSAYYRLLGIFLLLENKAKVLTTICIYIIFNFRNEKREMQEMQEELEDLRDCGLGSCKPACLQPAANIKVFILLLFLILYSRFLWQSIQCNIIPILQKKYSTIN